MTEPIVEAGRLVTLTSSGGRGGENCESSKSKRGPSGTPKSIVVAGPEVGPASPGGTAAGAGETALSWLGSTGLLEGDVLEVAGADVVDSAGAAARDELGAAAAAVDGFESTADAEASSPAAVVVLGLAVVGGRGTIVGTNSVVATEVEASGTVVAGLGG